MKRNLETCQRLAIALDTDDLEQAVNWAESVSGIFGVAKIGLQLFCSSGPLAVRRLQDMGFEVFLDLKLYDIPTTVNKSAAVIGALGASYMTVHSAGGVDMVRAAIEGLRGGAEKAGRDPARLLGVTVLSSVAGVSDSELEARVGVLREAGADGLVCAPPDLPLVESIAPDFVKVVPGIRRSGDDLADQVRVAGPDSAIAAGADILVIGRPITSSRDPRLVAQEMRDLVEKSQK